MTRKSASVLMSAAGIGLLAGCGSADLPDPISMAPVAIDTVTEPRVVERPAEPSLQERWASPFAVSSAGRVEPRERRRVTVLGADPAVAEALARREAEAERGDADGRDRGAPGDARTRSTSAADSARPGRGGDADAVAAAPDQDADSVDPDQPDADRGPVPRNRNRGVDDERPTRHLVERGQTFLGIARRYDLTWSELEAANPEINPERIRAGATLAIPPSPRAPAEVTHRVSTGDTLWGIARRYNVPPGRIREANGMDGDRVRIGQILLIPVTTDMD